MRANIVQVDARTLHGWWRCISIVTIFIVMHEDAIFQFQMLVLDVLSMALQSVFVLIRFTTN